MIPETMWAYRTMVKTTSRYPLFTLAFRINAVALGELV